MMGLSGTRIDNDTWDVRQSLIPETNLVKSLTLAAPWIKERKFYLLNGYIESQDDLIGVQATIYSIFEELLDERRAAGDLTAWVHGAQIAVMTASDSTLASTADRQDSIAIGARTSGDERTQVFPQHSCHAIVFRPELYARSKIPQILIGFDQDPQLLADLGATEAASIDKKNFAQGRVFSSSSAIVDSLISGSTYLGPLLGCISPSVWAVHAQRLRVPIVFALGHTVSGISATPTEMLQLLPHALAYGPPPEKPTELEQKSCSEAIDWWALKLDRMFKYLSDPTLFADRNGNYLPYLHQNWMMTVDQLFQRIGSIATSYRDIYAQQVLMFGALDALGDTVRNTGSQALYMQDRAEKALETLRSSVPRPAAKLLLPLAERAVAALRGVRDGFFITKRLGTSHIKITTNKGTRESWRLDVATKKLLRARRNATHGFGGFHEHDDDNVRILAHHDGQLPRDLVYLPYLYLLEMLCTPDEVITTICDVGTKIE